MCGIAGFSGSGDEGMLVEMNNTLAHRGPDDYGIKVFPIALKNGAPLALAQRRLSIIDLTSAGHQPMTNSDETVWVVFNGEIYNYQTLRKDLKGKYVFRGESDTEVLVHLYKEHGAEMFSKLEGMFAIALYDVERQLLLLARDHMGKKPLYWSTQGNDFLFGSELKALMAHPSFKKEIDPASLNKYFQYEYVPTPHTIFKNTWKLEPGTVLTWDGVRVEKNTFWQPTFLPKSDSFEAALVDLDNDLREATERRLVADVPLGVFLSGGIDSSTVAYYATRASKEKVKTFAIGFKEASFDESKYARLVAEHLGTEHHEEILSVHSCLELIPEVAGMLDEPMADSSIIPTYLLSEFTRQHVVVALGGDGGDELFCGYDTLLAHRLATAYRFVPKTLRGAITLMVDHLPTSHKNMSLDFKLKKFTGGFEGPPQYRNQNWLGAFDRMSRSRLFKKEVWEKIEASNEFEDIDRYLKTTDSHDMYDELALLYERMYMMDQILVKVDRASMMHGLEVRSPFLDTNVVDTANHLPTEYKLKGLTRKYILKKLMRGKLPDEIINRKKKGFGMPIGEWMRAEMRPLLTETLKKETLDEIGLFDTEYVEQLLNEHLEGVKDNRKQLWALLVFVLWWLRWMK